MKTIIEKSLQNFSFIFILFFIIVIFVIPSNGQKTESLEDIIKIAEKGDNLIQSCRGTIIYIPEIDSTDFQKIYNEFGKRNGMVFTKKAETLFIYKNPQFTLDTKVYGKSFPGNKDQIIQETFIYDGKDTYSKEISFDRFIKNPEYDKRPLNGLTYLEGYYIHSTPVSVFLKGSVYGPADKTFLLKNFKQLDDEKPGNISCKVFNAEYFDDTYNHNITVWLARDMMYRPVKIQDIIKGKNSQNNDFENSGTSNITLKNIQGLWVPELIERQSIHKDFKTNEWKNPSKSKTLLSNFEFNIDIPDSLFIVPEDSLSVKD